MAKKQADGKGNFEMESSEGAATARDSEGSGRGDGGKAGVAGEKGWARAPVASCEDEADAQESEATDEVNHHI